LTGAAAQAGEDAEGFPLLVSKRGGFGLRQPGVQHGQDVLLAQDLGNGTIFSDNQFRIRIILVTWIRIRIKLKSGFASGSAPPHQSDKLDPDPHHLQMTSQNVPYGI
jgi:hypothetical protein